MSAWICWMRVLQIQQHFVFKIFGKGHTKMRYGAYLFVYFVASVSP